MWKKLENAVIPKAKNLARFGLAVVVFFVSMEVCARVDDKIKYQAPLFGEYSPDRLRERDQDGIRHNIPNSRFEKWEINEYGFRGEAFSIEKQAGVRRIVCMGTSESFGLYESAGKEWPSQLAEMLSDKGKYQVINASVVGLPLRQFAPYIEKYVMPFQPDVVILYVNPYFYAQEKLAQKSGGAEKTTERQPKSEAKLEAREKLSMTPRLGGKMKLAVKEALPPTLLKKYQLWSMSREIRAIENEELKDKEPVDTVPQRVLESFREDLIRLVSFLANGNIQVVLSSYPVLICYENMDRHQEIFLDNRRFSIMLSLKGLIEAPRQFDLQIESVAREFGRAFVENAGAIPRRTDFFGDNVHYTNRGAQVVAKNFMNCILAR
jgi:hypothetical protein